MKTLDDFIKEFEFRASQKARLIKDIEEDNRVRTLTIKRLTESKEEAETLAGLLRELKSYRDARCDRDY